MIATLQNGTFRENLVFVHENQRLLDIDDLSKILKDGPSQNLQINVMNSGFVMKERDYLVRSEDAKWMSLDLISTVGYTEASKKVMGNTKNT